MINRRKFSWQVLTGIAGLAIGLFMITISLYTKHKGLDAAPFIRIHYFLLLLYAVNVLVISFAVLLRPKLCNISIGTGCVILIVISVNSNLLLSPVDSSLLFAKINRDAAGYVRYAANLAGYLQAVPEHDFYPDATWHVSPSVAFSPDGQIIASGSRDGTISIWNNNGKLIVKPFIAHEGAVNSVAFSPNGKRLVSGGDDGTVRVWDCQGHPICKPFCGHEGAVYCVACSPNGKYIVSGGWDGSIRLWDYTGLLIGAPFLGHESSVYAVAFSPDGNLIASGSADDTLRMWGIHGNYVGKPFRGVNYITSIMFSPNEKIVLAAGRGGCSAILWDYQGRQITKLNAESRWIINLAAFSPDGEIIATSNYKGQIRLWDRHGNPIGKPFHETGDTNTSVAFSPDGQIIAVGSCDGNIYMLGINGQLVGEPLRGSQGVKRESRLSHHYRSLGYPLILSIFMRLTGQYNSVAAAICQPIILSIVIIFVILWIWKKFGLLYAIALTIPFLDPANDMIKLAAYEDSDFILSIFFIAITILLYRIVLSNSKYCFLAWFVVTFIAAGIKMIVGVMIILVCISIFSVLCVGKLSNRVWADKYNLITISRKLLLILLCTVVISLIHTKIISPGAALFNRHALWARCYWIPAQSNKNELLAKIHRLQTWANKRQPFVFDDYAGAGLYTAWNDWAPIMSHIPVLAESSRPFVDIDNNEILELSCEEFDRGGYLLIRNNPLFFIQAGLKHLRKDCKNLCIFSENGRRHFLYGAMCVLFFLIGIVSLYRSNNLITASLLMAYLLFFVFISYAAIAVIRYLLPFVGFYYAALSVGIASVAKAVWKNYLKTF